MALLGGCAPQQPDARNGREPTIVSLNPCSDAILAEVAAPGQLLAISHYSHDPASTSMKLDRAREFAVTGGTVEEVVALDPDIVVGSSFMAPATRAAFDRLGIEVVQLGMASSVEASLQQVRDLADAVGQSERGGAMIARIKGALEETRSDADPTPAVLWQPGGIVPGEGALVSELMAHTGLASHSAARGLQQADYLSLERMLVDPPDVLLVAGQERAQTHPALGQLNELRTERFDANLLYCGGPSIIRALERLAELRR
ncbi:putative ABC-type cobalamin/Fe3+-siderophores transport systems,periplasmic components [Erythrobacter litoralis HTCC2594]|uniref:Putative ABC-type cobalamin/Fe3+-siderophores transport systems,periplasmic components n=2 Tax=Erythrobacter litoralis TaxID=39960 RepID=Q2N9F8_ERYLH|nr:putative ABC-type cobalamin/Fe3+-siderophores transport systems,periplasmic components [Erythrobacter litoralis HTCC2594]